MKRFIQQKAAFTLAEVLITLGIIGVVAAITMPTLIQNYEEHKRVNQLKKAYSVINNAFLMAKNEYGEITDWDLTVTYKGTDSDGNMILDETGQQVVMNNLMKYVQGAEITSESSEIYMLSLDGAQLTPYWPWNLKGGFRTNDGTVYKIGWISSTDCNGIRLQDSGGATIQNACSDFWIILPPKKQMRLGVDAFNFALTKNGIVPVHYMYFCNPKSSVDSEQNGRGCSGYVLAEGNMNYLHK